MNTLVIVGAVVAFIVILLVVGAFLMMGGEEEPKPEIIAETTLPPETKNLGARYINIEKVEPSPGMDVLSSHNINLMEVIATDAAGNSVLSGATVTGTTPALGGFVYSNLIDGNETTMAHNTPTPTSTREGLFITLAEDKQVSKIEVVNRPGFNTRAIGLKITVLDSAKNQIFSSDIIRNPLPRYSFTL